MPLLTLVKALLPIMAGTVVAPATKMLGGIGGGVASPGAAGRAVLVAPAATSCIKPAGADPAPGCCKEAQGGLGAANGLLAGLLG